MNIIVIIPIQNSSDHPIFITMTLDEIVAFMYNLVHHTIAAS